MKRWLIALLLLIIPAIALANWMYLPGPGYSRAVVGATFTYTYCVRADGTATKTNATDCSSASSSMSLATFNASTFEAGEEIAFSSRGGGFGQVTIPSGGSVGNPIVYKGEPDNIPTFDPVGTGSGIVCNQSYVTLNDLNTDDADASGLYSLHFASGTLEGVLTNNLTLQNAPSEGVRHEAQVTVVHSGLHISGVGEPITSHSTTGGTITITESTITGYDEALRTSPGCNANFVVTDSTFTAAPGGRLVVTNVSTGTYDIERNVITDAGTARGWDLRNAGVLTLKNNIITGGTTGDFYILPKTGSLIYNNTFYGFDPSNSLIFNNVAMTIKNNIFDTVPNALYGSTGTIDSNCFYNSGTVQGTNAVTSDPALDTNGKLTASSTSVIGAGVGPATDSIVPTQDIDGDTRSGTTTDIGADLY